MNILIKYGSWPVIMALCLYTESQYVSVRHTEENGYMSANLLPPVHCMSSCYVASLFGVYSFTLFD